MPDNRKEFDAALRAYREWQGIAQQLVGKTPTNYISQACWFACSVGISAELASKQDYDEAFKAVRDGFEASKRASTLLMPSNETGRLKLLQKSSSEWAQLAESRRNLNGALYLCREANRQIEEGIERGIGGGELQQAATKNHASIGRLLAAQGDRTNAIAEFQRALVLIGKFQLKDQLLQQEFQGRIKTCEAILQKQANLDPDNADSQRQLGRLLESAGDFSGALQAFQASVEICKRSLSGDPNSLSTLEELAISHDAIAGIHDGGDNFDAALAAYREYQAVAQRLVEKNPSYRSRLSQSYRGIYRQLASKRNYDEAFRALKDGLDVFRSEGGLESTNEKVRLDALEVARLWSDYAELKRDLNGALYVYREVNGRIERALENGRIRRELESAKIKNHGSIAKILATQGHQGNALAEYEQALALADRLGNKDEGLLTEIRAKIKELSRRK